MTQLEKAREEILNWHIAHNSHPQEWNYYRRELKGLRLTVKAIFSPITALSQQNSDNDSLSKNRVYLKTIKIK